MKIMTAKIMSSKNTVESKPPEGYKKVTQIYIEPQTNVLVVVKED